MLPAGIGSDDFRLGHTKDLVGRFSGLPQSPDFATHGLDVGGQVEGDLDRAEIAVTGDDQAGIESLETVEDLRPACSVQVGVSRRKPGKDGKHTFLDQVAREQDSFFRQQDDLVAARVSRADTVQFDTAAAEIDLCPRPVIDDVRHDEIGSIKRRGGCGALCLPEQVDEAGALLGQLVSLGAVV